MESLNIQSSTAIEKLAQLTLKIEKLISVIEKNNNLLEANNLDATPYHAVDTINEKKKRLILKSQFESISEGILFVLKKQPAGATVQELSEQTGWSTSQIRVELLLLEESDKVSRRRSGIKRTFAYVLRQNN